METPAQSFLVGTCAADRIGPWGNQLQIGHALGEARSYMLLSCAGSGLPKGPVQRTFSTPYKLGYEWFCQSPALGPKVG